MACVNYAAFVIVIKNNHLCYILYYILVQTRMIWCLKYFFHILKIGNEKKKKYKPATEQCQHPFCLCVSMRDTSTLYIFFVLLSVWSFDLFLAVIPSHRYIDFVAPTADFMIFVTWIWNLVVFDWLFFPGAQLWLLSLWLWFAVGSNLPAGFSYVMQQAPLRARWGRPVMQLRYQIPMWSCTTAPWATSVFYTGRCRCQQTVECD